MNHDLELDLNMLKVICNNTSKALEFANSFDNVLFSNQTKSRAKLITDFIKAYRSLPTKRTLLDRYSDSPEQAEDLAKFWNQIENHQYNEKDFSYDLSKAKERFKEQSITRIQGLTSGSYDQEALLKQIGIILQQTNIVAEGRSHIQKSVAEYTEEFTDKYEAGKNPNIERPEIKTGYSMLDYVTGGFSPAELILIGGETGAGKSQFLNNLGIQMWMQSNTIDTPPSEFRRGYNILYFSLEMPYENCFNRFLARLADVPQRKIKDSSLDVYEFEKVQRALKFIKEYEKAGNFFSIVDVPRGLTIEEVELRYSEEILKCRPDVVVIDYMGLMHESNPSKEGDWLKLGNIAASLHEFSRAYNVVMLTAVQLTDIKRGTKSKADQEQSQKVGMHRIGRSSHVGHHVNVAIQIETRTNEINLPDLKYHVIKNRNGALGQGNLIKNFEHGALYDVPYAEESNSQDISANIPELIRQIRDINAQNV